jgi:hypothetical protein
MTHGGALQGSVVELLPLPEAFQEDGFVLCRFLFTWRLASPLGG